MPDCETSRSAQSGQWSILLPVAHEEVNGLLRALPPHLKTETRLLSIIYDPRTSDPEDDVDPELLGRFEGQPLLELKSGLEALPPAIVLFLNNLWAFAGAELTEYKLEVRATFMHELGHFLGLDEIDLDERGLA